MAPTQMEGTSEVLRRICLAYPWSAECRSIPPLIPTEAENAALWHGPGGFIHAAGKEIPPGTRCESVQLIPVDDVMKPRIDPQVVAVPPSPGLGMYTQIPRPMAQAMTPMPLILGVSAFFPNRSSINNFL